MNIRKLAAVSALSALLAACAGTSPEPARTTMPHDHSASSETTAPVPSGRTPAPQTFSCQNGMTARVTYSPAADSITLAVDTIGSSTRLANAVAASGERYTNPRGFYNHETEWHMKGGEAVFSFKDPEGNLVETNCRAK